MSCQGVFIYFTDTLEAMKNFGNGHKNHWFLREENVSLSSNKGGIKVDYKWRDCI